jgi:SET domain-containing protein
MLYKKALARYANDAKGITKVKGLTNNSRYVKDNGRVFIVAIKDIEADSEILVGYKKEYWDTIIYNKKLAAYEERLKKRKAKRNK